MKETTIYEDMEIQNAIDDALDSICKKYNIVIVHLDYLWDYKENL